MNEPHDSPPPFGDEPGRWTAPPGPPTGQPPTPSGGTPPPPPGQWGAPPSSPPTQWGAEQPPQWGAPAAPPPTGQWSTPVPPQPGQFLGQVPAQPYVPGGGTSWTAGNLEASIATPGIRIGAKLLDVLFTSVIGVVLGIIAGLFAFSTSSISPFDPDASTQLTTNLGFTLVVLVLQLAIDFVYNVVLVAKFGGQPGKRLLGLSIVGQADGTHPDMRVAFMRWTPSLVILVVSAIPLIGLVGGVARFGLAVANLVMIFADSRRRDVFDLVASTYVVRSR